MVRFSVTLILVAGMLPACSNPCDDSGATCMVFGTGEQGGTLGETDPLAHRLYGPMDVMVEPGTDNIYVGDWNNHNIKRLKDGVVDVVVGTDFLGDGDVEFNERSAPGVPGDTVALNHPTQMEWNTATGRMLLPSWHNHRIREWDPATGNSLVVSANTDTGDGNGANLGFAGDGGPASDALFGFPNSIAIDPDDGSFWVLDQKNLRVRKIAHDFSLIETVAGSGGVGADDGSAMDASFSFWPLDDLQPDPSGAVEYHDGQLYIADTANHAIRVLDIAAGTVSTLVDGSAQTGSVKGEGCDPDLLCLPRDIEVAPDGTLYVADAGNHVIRSVDATTGELTLVVGSFAEGMSEDGAVGDEVALDRPHGIDVDDNGALYIADTYNHRILRVTP